MEILRKTFVAVAVLMASLTVMAETTEPAIGIVNRKSCGTFWRIDFNYKTIDTDGETPIVLSAAIFMSKSIYDKATKAKGCGLINHYTITDNQSRPTNETMCRQEWKACSTPFLKRKPTTYTVSMVA
ncbi:MAG: hypothetical protein PUC79_02290 [Prevotellaceae bacterium]|nr:hypothetical protein [Prevotellaceae bacterium]